MIKGKERAIETQRQRLSEIKVKINKSGETAGQSLRVFKGPPGFIYAMSFRAGLQTQAF